MRTMPIGETGIQASRISLGCMGFGGGWDGSPLKPEDQRQAVDAILCALDAGINFFDHADIYCMGKSEEAFSAIWGKKPSLRPKVFLQSKCGIRFAGDPDPSSPKRYDFSKEHILHAVEGSLQRLKTDYLDILLLHRPDPLMEPEEVAAAFDMLHASGKVRYFGVSNHNARQMELLRKYLSQPIAANQMQLSLMHTAMIDEGIYVNVPRGGSVHGEGTIEYCRLHNITIQAWTPLAAGSFTRDRVDAGHEEMAALVERYAAEKNVSPEAIMIAWLLRHPAGIQPVIGTRTPGRIKAASQGARIQLTREEWYALYNSAADRKLI